jgi:mannosylglycoprotein endo-beta-mannosidase
MQKMTFSKRKNCWVIICVILLSFFSLSLSAQQYELNSGWKCARASAVNKTGEEVSGVNFPLAGWMPAVVPGTVLTSLLANKLIPDPFYGMNNEQIPDLYKIGGDYYTYWFVKDFTEKPGKDDRVWLLLRGVNDGCDIYLNGHKVNDRPEKSMYLRLRYDITPFLAKDGKNRLAVIVYPPSPAGNPNGGQGGDGMIAHNITNQYTAGWDWVQPVRDRNTGIWDKVFIRKTKQVIIENTHVVTHVPGVRRSFGVQAPATINVTAEVTNAGDKETEGLLQYELEHKVISIAVRMPAGSRDIISFPDVVLDSPALWWPNGYGKQPLYNIKVKFLLDGKVVSDEEDVTFGIRELQAVWNKTTNSRELRVNGQKIFIKGGNRIVSDAMLRFSRERYDAEVRFHRDMNLNLIRVWGGGITERPEFYDACDKYGLLVMQDFWVSGDCNGRWDDPMKLEDTTARRKYPDDHRLFIRSLEDQVKMLRNHPSLTFWCGGNEIKPPKDILAALKDTILPSLDGTRYFFSYSNDDSMSLHSGDGPYTIQQPDSFWVRRSFPFNSEVGSVGIGDYESLERFIPREHMVAPAYDTVARKWKIDSVWQYHKYIGYDSAVEVYGHPADVKDFARKAQLVNYEQYRALLEGFSAHMWDWYTGVIEWKTQNPWTAMVGQMYDVYLDPNACMYGLQEGAKPVHIMYDPINKSARIVNATGEKMNKVRMWIKAYGLDGTETDIAGKYVSLPAQTCDEYYTFTNTVKLLRQFQGLFLCMGLNDSADNVLDFNVYWFPDVRGDYSSFSEMAKANVTVTARQADKGVAEVLITNPFNGPVAFFNRISLVDAHTQQRILPVFYNNNYISLLPGQQQSVLINFTPRQGIVPKVSIEGWNVDRQLIELK